MRNGCCVIVGKTRRKMELGEPRHKWDNIKMYLTARYESVDWIHLSHRWAPVNAVASLQIS
jgi:hypothetical protein